MRGDTYADGSPAHKDPSPRRFKAKRLRWRRAGDHEGRIAYDLVWGDAVVLNVRYSREKRTFYFKSSGTGRNSLLAGDRFALAGLACEAGRSWVRQEISAGRPV
jgi:hypothetical protein